MVSKHHSEATDQPGSEPQAPATSDFLLKLQLESNPDSLTLVRATLERLAEFLHFSPSDSRSIVRSVDEALANVIRHAYAGKTGLPIAVTCRRLRIEDHGRTKLGIEILLEDSGNSPDLTKVTGRSLDEIRPGGLGLHFIRQSMDHVQFSRTEGKNQLRLVKYLVPVTAVASPGGE